MSAVKFINSNYLKGPKGDKGDKGDPGTGVLGTSGRITYNPKTKIVGFNATGLATESYVNSSISALINGAPTLLDTLKELADAIDNNPNFISEISTEIDLKLAIAGGTMTGPLILNADPTTALGAVTKQYVDDAINSVPTNTDGLAEGTTNLYFTNTRARTAISVTGAGSYDTTTGIITVVGGVTDVNGQNGTVVLDTDDVNEGTANLYYTTARANTDFDSRLATKTTTNLAEGANLYYTDARARAAISVAGDLSYDSSTGVISYTTPVGFSGNYNDLTNKPSIPTLLSQLTNDVGFITTETDAQTLSLVGNVLSISNGNSVTIEQFSGDYNDLTNKPSIPSQLTDLNIVDGASGQVLTTDGSGNFSFSTLDTGPGSWSDFIFDAGEYADTEGEEFNNGLMMLDGGLLDYYYTAADSTNWSGAPPTTLAEAVDRLAAVVKALNGGVGA